MAREEVPMSIRRLILDVDPKTLNVKQFCAQHGVSTWFFWDLRRRYAIEGDAVLEAKSRAPHRVANRTSASIEDAIVTKRKELVDAGLDAGPATIAWHLRNVPGLPSEATIWRILKARGLIVADPTKAPKPKGRSWTATRANECWALDDTTWALADGTEVKILNVLDDHSRLLVASVALVSCTGVAALDVLAAAAVDLGWAQRVWSDNARAFTHVLAGALRTLGVADSHTKPYSPRSNGKVERFHQTLKRWLAAQPPAATLAELQAQLDSFRHLYNHLRPHRGIGRRTPAEVWEQAPKCGPSARPFGTPSTFHRGTVRAGTLRVGRRYRITLGASHNNTQAIAITTGLACHIFINGRLVRQLQLDPTRERQPLHNKPGRPKHLP
jgi:transposase InsO family protein